MNPRSAHLLGLEAVSENMLEHDEEVLQGHVVRVEHAAMFE